MTEWLGMAVGLAEKPGNAGGVKTGHSFQSWVDKHLLHAEVGKRWPET